MAIGFELSVQKTGPTKGLLKIRSTVTAVTIFVTLPISSPTHAYKKGYMTALRIWVPHQLLQRQGKYAISKQKCNTHKVQYKLNDVSHLMNYHKLSFTNKTTNIIYTYCNIINMSCNMFIPSYSPLVHWWDCSWHRVSSHTQNLGGFQWAQSFTLDLILWNKLWPNKQACGSWWTNSVGLLL